ncbi:MAG: leucine-rich repeat domain-containing protein, partial [Oscillospiraceae bacterium]|nr:leucine-rich repeat domain-containing protein [Oscillospiraceae bacterium]
MKGYKKFSKVMVLALALALLVSVTPIAAPLTALAAVGDTVVADGLNYNILTMPTEGKNGTVEVGDNMSYTGKTVTIPATITVSGGGNDGTYDVVEIMRYAFSEFKPEEFSLGKDGPMRGNLNIETLDLSGATNLKLIDIYAFAQCANLKGDLTIPDSVTDIRVGVFMYTGYKGVLTLPASMFSIHPYAFYDLEFALVDSSMKITGNIWPDAFTNINTIPLICTPELAHIHYNCGFRDITVKPFIPVISVNDDIKIVLLGESFTVAIDLGCAPTETTLTSDMLNVTGGTAGAFEYTPYINYYNNVYSPTENTIATCEITPDDNYLGAVTVSIGAGA